MTTWPVPDFALHDHGDVATLKARVTDPLNDLSDHTHSGAGGDGSASLVPTSITMGGPFYQKKGADIAAFTAGTTITLGSDGDYFVFTAGTGNINAISSRQAGARVTLRFTNAQTVAYNGTSLILQSGGNWSAPAGSAIELISEGSGNWRELWRWVGGVILKGSAFLRPWKLSGSVLADQALGVAIYDQIGVGAADGAAHFSWEVPSDWAAITKAVFVYAGTTGSGRTERMKVDGNLSAVGQLYNNRVTAITAANVASIDNAKHHELDISSILSGLLAGDLVAIKVTNLASDATGGAQQDPIYAIGVQLEWRG